ncbi:MAG TPA: hypothetical protein VFK39_14645 [Gemmatimonadaceae bacterium]|nr:hypothetical protein [Gemmatimonadaceae bacterium]
MDAGVIVPLGFFAMVAVIVVGSPLARAFARKMSNQAIAPAVPAELQQRLEHMEQAIDSIAVEVERISEGQRFTTKLLADRNPEAHSALAASERERR